MKLKHRPRLLYEVLNSFKCERYFFLVSFLIITRNFYLWIYGLISLNVDWMDCYQHLERISCQLHFYKYIYLESW